MKYSNYYFSTSYSFYYIGGSISTITKHNLHFLMKSSMTKPSHSGMIILARFSRKSGEATPTYGTGQVPEGSGQVITAEKKL